MVWFWHWAVRGPFAALGICAFGMAAAGVIEWSLGLSTLAVSAIAADAAHHLGNRAQRRRQKRHGIVEAPHGHSFYDYSDYERSEKRAA
jgi:hypothetical protein